MSTTSLTLQRSRAPALEWLARCLERPRPAHAGQMAYAVPWEEALGPAPGWGPPVRCFVHIGDEVLLQTRVWRLCDCGLVASLPVRVVPGDEVSVTRQGCGVCPSETQRWYLRWVSAQAGELVWPFVW